MTCSYCYDGRVAELSQHVAILHVPITFLFIARYSLAATLIQPTQAAPIQIVVHLHDCRIEADQLLPTVLAHEQA